MVNIRLKILDKGHIVQEQLIRVLQKHEDAIASNSTGDSAIAEVVGDKDSGLVKGLADLEARVKALEDAQTPTTETTEPSG